TESPFAWHGPRVTAGQAPAARKPEVRHEARSPRPRPSRRMRHRLRPDRPPARPREPGQRPRGHRAERTLPQGRPARRVAQAVRPGPQRGRERCRRQARGSEVVVGKPDLTPVLDAVFQVAHDEWATLGPPMREKLTRLESHANAVLADAVAVPPKITLAEAEDALASKALAVRSALTIAAKDALDAAPGAALSIIETIVPVLVQIALAAA